MYNFEYINENEFRKLERTLKKYNMLAYKKLYFEYYPQIKTGKFSGKVISKNKNVITYELALPTDRMFAQVHGEISIVYEVYEKEKIIILKTINPEDILEEGHHKELTTYKGVLLSKDHSTKDMFKIDLLNMIKK